MTRRTLLAAAALAAAGIGLVAPNASANTSVHAADGNYACAWLLSEGVCISNPTKDLPPLP